MRKFIRQRYAEFAYKSKNNRIIDLSSSTIEYRLIISTGRTGTVYLNNVLNHIGCHARHEPCNLEPHLHRFRSENESFFKDFGRYKYNQILSFAKNEHVYCEINPYMRCFIPDIQAFYPKLRVLGIYRSGIEVIASMYARSTLTKHDSVYKNFVFPHPELKENNEEYRRFEKLCFYWMSQMNYVLQHADIMIAFDEVVNIKKNGSEKLFNFLGLDYKIENHIGEYSRNATSESLKLTLNTKHYEIFERICSEFENQNNLV